jgi:hypothetical protein
VTLLVAAPAVFDVGPEVAAFGLIALVLAPMVNIWLRTKQFIIADPLVIVGMVWIIAAALPVLLPSLYSDLIWTKFSNEMRETAVLWMYRGWAACSVTYWVVRSNGQVRQCRQASRLDLAREDRLRWLVGLSGLLGAVGTTILTNGQGYTFIETADAASSFGMLFHELKQFAVIYIFLYFHARGRGRLMRWEPRLLLAVLVAELAIVVAAGSKGVVFELMAASFIGNAAGSSRAGFMKELAVVAAALVAAYFAFNVITHFRNEMLRRDLTTNQSYMAALSVQINVMETAIVNVLSGRPVPGQEQEYGSGNILDRFGYLSAFGMLLEQTGGQSPYENALPSLAAPIVAFIPRDLVSEKVHFFNSGDFGKMLGWGFGGFSVTMPGSFFWAWGYEGILAGMSMFGACLALLANGSNADGVTGLVFRAVMFRQVMMMLDVGQEFQPIMIGMVRTTMFLLALVLVSRLHRFAHPGAIFQRRAR